MNPLSPRELLRESAPGVMEFFEKREQESGGYSAGSCLPPTVEDTYHALRCLSVLNVSPTRAARHMEFICSRLSGEWSSCRRLFQLAWCAIWLARSNELERPSLLSMHAIMEFVAARVEKVNSLHEHFYAARLYGLFQGSWPRPVGLASTSMEFPARTLAEIRMKAYLCQFTEKHAKVELGRLSALVERCRNQDGGYGFLPGTTSFIENLYHALSTLSLSGRAPQDIALSTGFVRACRSARGGFGRRCQGVPFPDSTWYAVASLHILSSTAI